MFRGRKYIDLFVVVALFHVFHESLHGYLGQQNKVVNAMLLPIGMAASIILIHDWILLKIFCPVLGQLKQNATKRTKRGERIGFDRGDEGGRRSQHEDHFCTVTLPPRNMLWAEAHVGRRIGECKRIPQIQAVDLLGLGERRRV